MHRAIMEGLDAILQRRVKQSRGGRKTWPNSNPRTNEVRADCPCKETREPKESAVQAGNGTLSKTRARITEVRFWCRVRLKATGPSARSVTKILKNETGFHTRWCDGFREAGRIE